MKSRQPTNKQQRDKALEEINKRFATIPLFGPPPKRVKPKRQAPHKPIDDDVPF